MQPKAPLTPFRARVPRPAVVMAAALVLLAGCRGQTHNYSWGWYEVLPTTAQGSTHLKFMLLGLKTTVSVSLAALGISILLGLAVALPGLSRRGWLRAVNRVYVELFRSVPVLVMILWVYYGLPVVLGISLDPFVAGVVALSLCDSAFEAEIFRGGIQSVDCGQVEAASALGMTYLQKMRHVILPQALRTVLPPLGNQFVYMLKMSALVSVIGLPELTRKANELTVSVYRPLEIYTVLVVEYLVLILFFSQCVRWVERRLQGSVERRCIT